MQHACASRRWGVVESHRVAEHDATLAKRRGQRFVGGVSSACVPDVGRNRRDRRSDRVRRRQCRARWSRRPSPSDERSGHQCGRAARAIGRSSTGYRSSTSTMTTRPPGGLVRADRSRMSYAALSSRPRSVGGKTASTAVTITAPTPHRNTRRRRVGRAFGNLAKAVRLPHGDVDAPIAGLRGFIGRLDQRIELADRRDVDGRTIEAGRSRGDFEPSSPASTRARSSPAGFPSCRCAR